MTEKVKAKDVKGLSKSTIAKRKKVKVRIRNK